MAVGLQIIDGDIAISQAGNLIYSSGNDKCLRDFGKMLKTDAEYPGNETSYYRYNPTYGTLLRRRELFKGIRRSATIDVVNTIVNNAIQTYITLQESRDNLSLEEIITNVELFSFFDAGNKNNIICKINIQNAAGMTSELGFIQSIQ